MSELGLEHRFADGDPAAPAFLLLHGTGGTPDDLLPLATALDPKAAVLAPAGPVSEHGMARWFRRVAEGVFDHEDVIARANQLADFILAAREEYGIAGRRLVAVGFSNGANIAAAVMLLRPDALTEAVAFAAMRPLPEPPRLDLAGSRMLLSNGTRDPMAPVPSVDLLVDDLRQRSADVHVHRHDGGHQVSSAGVADAREWLKPA